MTPYSALVITHQRNEHLARTVRGLERQSRPPAEIVVVYMNEPDPPILQATVPIVTVHLSSAGTLPLARARNTAAASASSEVLVFLDVDCIPADDFSEVITDDLQQWGGLVMGTPHYLGPGWDDRRDLRRQSAPHPGRSELTTGPNPDFALFWSLCFAMTSHDFHRSGGFDERFTGYGAEDTDFAFAAEAAGLHFALSTATAFHQYHDSCTPPLDHFDDIVVNARVFRDKWGRWPMEGWLQRFTELDLVKWRSDAEDIVVQRPPTTDEVNTARSAGVFA